MTRMKRKILAFCTIVALSSLPVHEAQANDWPQLKGPPNAHVVWVADDMVQNGVPMQIKQFSSRMRPEDVIRFYQSEWDDGSQRKPVLNKLGEWTIIGKQFSEYYVTVQVKPGQSGGSEGFLGASKLPAGIKSKTTTDFPMLANSKLLSKTDSIDLTADANTIMLSNNYSVQSNTGFYESKMPERGWTLTRKDRVPGKGGYASFLYFQDDNRACTIVINQSRIGESLIVANVVQSKD
jgi:hypothetical protein